MKVLILVISALAAASAAYAPLGYSFYPQHYAAIGPNGAPVETPEVQHARAAHLAAHAAARYGAAPLAHYAVPAFSHNALPLDTPEVAQARAQHFHDYAVAAQRNGVHAPLLAAGGSHYPVDTPEVQLAKAAHFAAHAAARGHHYRRRRGLYYPQHIPVIDHNGVPVETPEVQHARAAHYAAHAQARSGAIHSNYGGYAPIAYNAGGALVDTPEVEHAKAAHFAAHAEALGRVGHGGHALAYGGPWVHTPHAEIGHDGQPVETHEVQAAKAAHFAAHAAVRGHYY